MTSRELRLEEGQEMLFGFAKAKNQGEGDAEVEEGG